MDFCAPSNEYYNVDEMLMDVQAFVNNIKPINLISICEYCGKGYRTEHATWIVVYYWE